MIREIKLYWRLRPILNRFKELSKMKFSVNVAVQMLAVITQGINQTQDLLPPRAQFWAMVALSAIQGATAVIAHFVNPDGTPAAVGYSKGK